LDVFCKIHTGGQDFLLSAFFSGYGVVKWYLVCHTNPEVTHKGTASTEFTEI
jgi:hypothetical protein